MKKIIILFSIFILIFLNFINIFNITQWFNSENNLNLEVNNTSEIEKYKQIFKNQLNEKLKTLDKEKINLLIEKIDLLIIKNEKKYKILSQLKAIKIILQEDLINKEKLLNTSNAINCNSGYHLENKSCISNTKSCSFLYWVWEQTWNWHRTDCKLKNCSNWYSNINWICKKIVNNDIKNQECQTFKNNLNNLITELKQEQEVYDAYNKQIIILENVICSEVRQLLGQRWVDTSKMTHDELFWLSGDLWKNLTSSQSYKLLVATRSEYKTKLTETNKLLLEAKEVYNTECSK